MTVSYLAFYQVIADDPQAFVAYYKANHAAVLLKFPGLQKLVIHEKIDGVDQHEDPENAFLVIVEFVFSDLTAMEAGITKVQRLAAKESSANFPAFRGKTWHQTMATHELHPDPANP